MSRFAKVGEEAVKRNAELVGEELRLYVLIVFHTWTDSGVCKKTLRELADIYGLEYHNTTRRYKSLRKKQWCENTKLGIRPLVGLKNVKITLDDDEKSVNFTPLKPPQSVKTTLSECKNYTENDEKSVNSTPAFKGNIEPLKTGDFSSEPSETKIVSDTTTANSNNGHKSQFSKEEIIRYLDIRVSRGEQIETPHKLAQWMYQTGESDAFISATLYPEPIEQTIEYDDNEAPIGDDVPHRLPESVLSVHLYDFKMMSDDEFAEYEKSYTEDNWQWLVQHRK